MHGNFEIKAGAACPGTAVFDVAGKALLAAIEVDGSHALAGFHQGDSDMQRGGRFARTALFITQHDHMSRTGPPLSSLHQHALTPMDIFKLRATPVK